jgi:hypothetical protein
MSDQRWKLYIESDVSDVKRDARDVIDTLTKIKTKAKELNAEMRTTQRTATGWATRSWGGAAASAGYYANDRMPLGNIGSKVGSAALGLASRAGRIGMGLAAAGATAGVYQAAVGTRDHMAYQSQMSMLQRFMGGNGWDRGNVDSRISDLERRTGVDDSDIAGHLNVVATDGEHDLDNAMKKIELALNVQARGWGDTDSVLKALNKASLPENVMMLKKLAQSANIAGTENMTASQAVEALAREANGAAEQAHKAKGGLGDLSVAFDNWRQSLGEKVFGGATGPASKMADAFRNPAEGTFVASIATASFNVQNGIIRHRMNSKLSALDEREDNADHLDAADRNKVNELAMSGKITREEANRRRAALDQVTATRRARFQAMRDKTTAEAENQIGQNNQMVNYATRQQGSDTTRSSSGGAPAVSDAALGKGKATGNSAPAPSSHITIEARVRTERGTATTITGRS